MTQSDPNESETRPRRRRPVLREPHPVRLWAVVLGAFTGGVWLVAFGLLGESLAGYLGWTLTAGLAAWAAAYGLVRFGDRGVAVGVAAAVGMAWTAAALSVVAEWNRVGYWPL